MSVNPYFVCYDISISLSLSLSLSPSLPPWVNVSMDRYGNNRLRLTPQFISGPPLPSPSSSSQSISPSPFLPPLPHPSSSLHPKALKIQRATWEGGGGRKWTLNFVNIFVLVWLNWKMLSNFISIGVSSLIGDLSVLFANFLTFKYMRIIYADTLIYLYINSVEVVRSCIIYVCMLYIA